jgi:hypothetical protein
MDNTPRTISIGVGKETETTNQKGKDKIKRIKPSLSQIFISSNY